MRVMHVHWRYDAYGGGERYLGDICRAQLEAGHVATVLTTRADTCGSSLAPRVLLVNPSGGLRSGLRELPRVLRILAEESPDIVHVHQTHHFFSPLIIHAIRRKTPIVKTVHDLGLICFKTAPEEIKIFENDLCRRRMGVRCVLSRCHSLRGGRWRQMLISQWELRTVKTLDRVLVGSAYLRRELLRNGFKSERVEVVPLYTEMRRALPVSAGSGQRRVLFVGRLNDGKGISQFIEALERVQHKSWSADIVGMGPLADDARAMIRRANLEGRIAMHGVVPFERIGEFYEGAYLVAVPSMAPETFGLVGIEAMGSGKAVIAFDSGGITEWLIDGETGFLVPRADVAALAERISRLLDDEPLARRLGEQARARVDARYRREQALGRLFDIYARVVAERRTA